MWTVSSKWDFFLKKIKTKQQQQQNLQERGQSPSNEERISQHTRNSNSWDKQTRPYCMCNTYPRTPMSDQDRISPYMLNNKIKVSDQDRISPYMLNKKIKTKQQQQQQNLQERGQSPSNEERISQHTRNSNSWHK